MPPPLYTQTVIAFLWDFDSTLIPGYQQDPIFERFDLDIVDFWQEVNGLVAHYNDTEDIEANPDIVYLNHLLTYVRDGRLAGLTNEVLKECGSELELCPGMPEFFTRSREFVASEPYRSHDISVEHYVISTGIYPVIFGSIGEFVDGIWANHFIENPAPPGYQNQLATGLSGIDGIEQLGYVVDNTSKTRAVFEINKGSNRHDIDVNAQIAEEDRRVPIRNMIYIADGASDIPVFSILGQKGGRRLGVYRTEGSSNFEEVKKLQDQGRVDHMTGADYSEGKDAYLWMMSTLKSIADEIVENRQRALASIPGTPKHVT